MRDVAVFTGVKDQRWQDDKPQLFDLSPDYLNPDLHSNNFSYRINSDGSSYDPSTQITSFKVRTAPEVKYVDLLVFDSVNDTKPINSLNMKAFEYQEDGFQLNAHLPRGTLYAYRLKDYKGDVLANHVCDPYALAETNFQWLEGEYINRIRTAQAELAVNGKIEAFPRNYQKFLELVGSPSERDYILPKSVVIDLNHVMELNGNRANADQPFAQHELGKLRVLKLHSLHSIGVPDEFISEGYRHLRGKLEILKDKKYQNFLRMHGVNAIEFYPLHPFVTCPELFAQGRKPWWGYMPSNSNAIDDDKFHERDKHKQIAEFISIVNDLKAAGFYVIMDYVLGHNAEKNQVTPSYSLSALDRNHHMHDNEGKKINLSGCSNTLNTFNPKTQELMISQVAYARKVFGVGIRFDQAAIFNAERASQENPGFASENYLTKQLYASGLSILEEGHAGPGGLHFGESAVLKDNSQPSLFKDFNFRNITDAINAGYQSYFPFVEKNTETMHSSLALLASGKTGSKHNSVKHLELTQNRGRNENPHDGFAVFDRAEVDGLLKFAKLHPEHRIANTVRKILKSSSSESYETRHKRLRECLNISDKYPEAAAKIQEYTVNRARMLLAHTFFSPGSLSIGFDAMLRTQDRNGNAFDQLTALTQAASFRESPYLNLPQAQRDTLKMVELACSIRDKHEYVFANINIFDGRTRSTVNPNISTEIRWYDKNGFLVQEDDWNRYRPKLREFLGVEYRSYKHHKDSFSDHSSIYVAISNLPREIKLPNFHELGHTWKPIFDSGRHSGEATQTFEKYGQVTYKLLNPAIVVFEKIRN